MTRGGQKRRYYRKPAASAAPSDAHSMEQNGVSLASTAAQTAQTAVDTVTEALSALKTKDEQQPTTQQSPQHQEQQQQPQPAPRHESRSHSPTRALEFFSHPTDPAVLQHHMHRGEQQLRDAEHEWLLSPEQEQHECDEFMEWSRQCKDVRCVECQVPTEILNSVFQSSTHHYTAVVCDFSPKCPAGDDVIYSRSHTIWQNVTRGCSMLVLQRHSIDSSDDSNTAVGAPIRRWLLRATHKFTGHEDDSTADARLYQVKHGVESTNAVLLTLKCNGSVLHIAGRKLQVPAHESSQAPHELRLLGLGSKNVHVVLPFSTNVAQLQSSLAHYNKGERFTLVHDMFRCVAKQLTQQSLFDWLSRYRLTVCTEFCVSVGSGPIDNRIVHQQQLDRAAAAADESTSVVAAVPLKSKQTHPVASEAFAFACSFSQLQARSGCELCLDPIYALTQLRTQFGFSTVPFRYESLPPAAPGTESPLEQLKLSICTLPDIEGSVIYHLDSVGVSELEKMKSCGYVCIRAVREKAKGLLAGRGRAAIGLQLAASHVQRDIDALQWQEIDQVPQQAGAVQPKQSKQPKQQQNAAPAVADGPADAGASASNRGRGRANRRNKNKAPVDVSQQESNATAGSNTAASLATVAQPQPQPRPLARPPSAPVSAGNSTQTVLVSSLTGNELDAIGQLLKSAGGNKAKSTANSWTFSRLLTKEEQQQITTAYCESRRATLRQMVAACQSAAARRIQSIDHVPMTPEQKRFWAEASKAFLEHLFRLVVEHHQAGSRLIECYSATWSDWFTEWRKSHKQNQSEDAAHSNDAQ